VYEPRTRTNLGAILLSGAHYAQTQNRKILHENEILKAIEPAPYV
jgi:hypothetical protein